VLSILSLLHPRVTLTMGRAAGKPAWAKYRCQEERR